MQLNESLFLNNRMKQFVECSSYEVTVTAHSRQDGSKQLFFFLTVSENPVDPLLNLLRTL